MKFSGFSEIMEYAVKREEEAARSYGRLMKKAEDPAVRQLLQDLQDDEKNHRKILLGLKKERIEASAGKDVQDLKISDYLVEEPLAAGMTLQDLLIFAAKKERKAAALYAGLAKKVQGKEHKKIFEFLSKQEKSHKLRLEIEYEKHFLGED